MIKKELLFNSFLDFCENKFRIKSEYDKLTIDEIILYKMYVFKTAFESEDVKDTMWEYLNNDEGALFELMRKYRIKKTKRKKDEIFNRFKTR